MWGLGTAWTLNRDPRGGCGAFPLVNHEGEVEEGWPVQYALYGCEQCPERRDWVDELPPLWWTRDDWWPVCHGCDSSEHVRIRAPLQPVTT